MIVNTLKKCCSICKYPDIEIEEHCFSDHKDVYIYCKHDTVCKYYNEDEKE